MAECVRASLHRSNGFMYSLEPDLLKHLGSCEPYFAVPVQIRLCNSTGGSMHCMQHTAGSKKINLCLFVRVAALIAETAERVYVGV